MTDPGSSLPRCRFCDASLVHTFVEEFNLRDQKAVKAVDPEAMRRLEAYKWPGNVRELRNVIERAVILAKGDFIEAKHLPPLTSERRAAPSSFSAGSDVMLTPGMTVDEAEQKLILATLDAAGGNKTRAAEELKVSRRTVIRAETDGDEPLPPSVRTALQNLES